MIGTTGAVWLAAILFVGVHILASTPLRAAVVRAIGEGPYLGVFSLAALATFIGLVYAFNRAPYEALWDPPAWALYLPLFTMPVAVFFLICGLTTPSPTGVRGERVAEGTEPVVGILRVTRHPVMWAVAIWALSHIPANGEEAALVLFGAMALLALLGMSLIDRKLEARLGAAWGPIALTTSVIPFLAAIQGRTPLRAWEYKWWQWALTGALYLSLLFLHDRFSASAPGRESAVSAAPTPFGRGGGGVRSA